MRLLAIALGHQCMTFCEQNAIFPEWQRLAVSMSIHVRVVELLVPAELPACHRREQRYPAGRGVRWYWTPWSLEWIELAETTVCLSSWIRSPSGRSHANPPAYRTVCRRGFHDAVHALVTAASCQDRQRHGVSKCRGTFAVSVF